MNHLLNQLKVCDFVETPDLEWRWMREKFTSSADLAEAVRRRICGEPLAYILGEKEFYALTFKVTPSVLIPRPETELLVDLSLKHLAQINDESYVLDLGCGSGCIGLSVLKNSPSSRLVAVDKSKEALEVAMANAKNLKRQDRTTFLNSDAADIQLQKNFDVVVANPPYVAPDDKNIDAAALAFEPKMALFAAENGLACIRSWIKVAAKHLKPGGIVIFEIGHQQGEAAKQIFIEAGFAQVSIHKDLAGHDRAVVGA